jgi:hypothetical protein
LRRHVEVSAAHRQQHAKLRGNEIACSESHNLIAIIAASKPNEARRNLSATRKDL